MSRSLKLLLVVSVVMLLIPVAASATTSLFEDVPDDSIFVNDINWMKTNGVTKGCNPPANTMYCPEANVTRQQMAAFMHRLAVNKVVDAKTAMDAGLLDGKDSTAFVPATALLPVASAMIDVDPGILDVTRGSGWSKATYVSKGVFCLKLDPSLGINAADIVVNVTVEWGRSAGFDLLAYWNDPAGSCPAGEVEIRTYDTFGGPALTDDVAFVATAFWSPDFGVIPMTKNFAGGSDAGENG